MASESAGSLVAEMRQAVRTSGLIDERSIVLMLSGGRDSVCLLDVLLSLREPRTLQALHVNYRLRPEAEEDEHHCRHVCECAGVQLHVVHPDQPQPETGNIQAWAREIRYRAAHALASGEVHGALLASAHTASDQVETILYRLAASPGRRALLGMREREGDLIRPLLRFTREQTTAYCETRNLAWRDDPTNESDLYVRGRLRHGLLMLLRSLHPAAEANVLRTAELLREETELLDALVEAELAGQDSISIERLAELQPALARLIVVRLAEGAAGTFVPQAGARVGEILALGRSGARAELHVGGLVSAVVQSGKLRMSKIEPHYPSPKGERSQPS